MKKRLSIMISAMLILALATSYSFATSDSTTESFEIDSIHDLNKAILEADQDNRITKIEENEILNNTEPSVLESYVETVDNVAADLLESAEPVREKYYAADDKTVTVYKVEVDPLSTVELVLTDAEDLSFKDTALNKAKSLFVDECYAATNGETLWKAYGNRYFTAEYSRSIGSGKVVMRTENHYNLSSTGITERYGNTRVQSITGNATVSSIKNSIQQKTATKAGNSNVRMLTQYNVNTKSSSYTFQERTQIDYLAKDTKNKKIKVKHSWKKI